MSEEIEDESLVKPPEENHYADDMDPRVRAIFERGNEIRMATTQITEYLNEYVDDMVSGWPGYEDQIRKALEGAAARLLGERDKRKRDERRAQEEAARAAKAAAAAAAKADNGEQPATNPGANGVSGTVHGSVRGNLEGGQKHEKPEGGNG